MRSTGCSPSFNIYSCDRSEKSKCASQGTPRANGEVRCMPDDSNASAPSTLVVRKEPHKQGERVSVNG